MELIQNKALTQTLLEFVADKEALDIQFNYYRDWFMRDKGFLYAGIDFRIKNSSLLDQTPLEKADWIDFDINESIELTNISDEIMSNVTVKTTSAIWLNRKGAVESLKNILFKAEEIKSLLKQELMETKT